VNETPLDNDGVLVDDDEANIVDVITMAVRYPGLRGRLGRHGSRRESPPSRASGRRSSCST
jgi:hypothetical protein